MRVRRFEKRFFSSKQPGWSALPVGAHFRIWKHTAREQPYKHSVGYFDFRHTHEWLVHNSINLDGEFYHKLIFLDTYKLRLDSKL